MADNRFTSPLLEAETGGGGRTTPIRRPPESIQSPTLPTPQPVQSPSQQSNLRWWEFDVADEGVLPQEPEQPVTLPQPSRNKPQSWIERYIQGPIAEAGGHFATLQREAIEAEDELFTSVKQRLGLEGDEVENNYRLASRPIISPWDNLPDEAGFTDKVGALHDMMGIAYGRVLHNPTLAGAIVRAVRVGAGEAITSTTERPAKWVKAELSTIQRQLPTVNGKPFVAGVIEQLPSLELSRDIPFTDQDFLFPTAQFRPGSLIENLVNEGVIEFDIGPSLDEQIETEFGPQDTDENLVRAVRAMDSIPVSLDYRNGQHLDFIRDYMGAGSPDEKEALLASYEDPWREMALEMLADPLIIAESAFKMGIQTAREERARHLAMDAITQWNDEYGYANNLVELARNRIPFIRSKSDWARAARHVSGFGRTRSARVAKINDIVTDGLNSISGTLGARTADDFISAVKNWDISVPFSQSFEGRIIGQPLLDQSDDFFRELNVKARQVELENGSIQDGLDYVKDELAKVVLARAVEEFGDPAHKNAFQRMTGWQKKMFSPVFLGYNFGYPVENHFDNARNMAFDLGVRAAGHYVVDVVKASLPGPLRRTDSVVAEVDKYWDRVGYVPIRATEGFGAGSIFTEAGFDKDAMGIVENFTEAIKNFKASPQKAVQHVVQGLRAGPTLAISGNLEELASMNTIRYAHKRAITDIAQVGVGIRPLPDTLVARMDALGPEGTDIRNLVESIINDPDTLNADEVLSKFEGWWRKQLESPGNRPLPAQHYINQVFDAETRSHLGADDVLMGVIRQVEDALSEAEVLDIKDTAFKVMDDFMLEVRKNRDAVEGMQVGWAVYDADKIRSLAGTANSLVANIPSVEQIAQSPHGSAADILWGIAHHRGAEPGNFMKPFTQAQAEAIQADAPADKLLDIFKQEVDEKYGVGTWDKHAPKGWLDSPRREPTNELKAELIQLSRSGEADVDVETIRAMSREETLEALGRAHGWKSIPDEVREHAVSDTRDLLEQLGKTPLEQGQFWQMYNHMSPQMINRAKKELDSFHHAATVNNAPRAVYEKAVKEFTTWAENLSTEGVKVFLDDDELDAVTDIRQAFQNYYKYKRDPDAVKRLVDPPDRPIKAPRRPYPNSADIYQFLDDMIKPGLEILFDNVIQDIGRAPTEIPRGLADAVKDWINTDVRKDFAASHYGAVRLATATRDFTILNYADKTYLDQVMEIFAPWQYWSTHNMWNWTVRLMDHPAIFSAYNRFQSTLEDITNDRNVPPHIAEWLTGEGVEDEELSGVFPSRLKGYFPLGLPRLFQQMEGQAFINFQEALFPFGALPLFGDVWMPDDPKEMSGASTAYSLFKGSVGTGPFVDMGIVFANNVLLPQMRDDKSILFNPDLAQRLEDTYLPPNALVQGGSFVPALRQIRDMSIVGAPAIEHILKGMGLNVTVPPGGWNPERTLLGGTQLGELMGITKKTATEIYWTKQHIAQMVSEGLVTEDEAWDDFISGSGPVWDQGFRRAMQQNAVKEIGRIATFGSSRVQFLPDSEAVLRGQGLLYQVALEKYRNGDRDALIHYYQMYPEFKLRQLAFHSWDLNTGQITPEELQVIEQDERDVTLYFRQRNALDEQWHWLQNVLVPGTPLFERGQRGYQEKRQELREQYEPAYNRWLEKRATLRDKAQAWAKRPKAQAMRSWLDMYYSADSPEEREAMLKALPASMSFAAMLSTGPHGLDSGFGGLMTQLDARRHLVKNYTPVDQMYAAAEDFYYRRTNEIFSVENDFSARFPEHASTFEEYINRDGKARATLREENPEFSVAYDAWQADRDSAWGAPLEITEGMIKEMLNLHPEWVGTDKEKELRQVVEEFPKYSLAEFSDRTKSDRDIIIRQVWRFWSSLTGVDKKNWKRKFPEFQNLLDGFTPAISDAQLAIWSRAIPDVYDPEGMEPFRSTKLQPGVDSPTKFTDLVEHVLAFEGGLSTNPDDSGNWTTGKIGEGKLKGTKYGISAAAYPGLDIENLTEDEARKIYERDYFIKSGANKLSWPLNLLHFDTAVNSGVGRANQFLEESGGDFETYVRLRREFFESIATGPKQQFLTGWLNRLNKIVSISRQQGGLTKPDNSFMRDPLGQGRMPFASDLESRLSPEGNLPIDSLNAGSLIQEPETENVFRPEIKFDRASDGSIRRFITPESTENARLRAMSVLRGNPDEPYRTWDDLVAKDPNPDGAREFLIDQLRVHGSISEAFRKNVNEWERFIVALKGMDEDERLDFLTDNPEAWAIWEIVEETEGPSANLYYSLIGEEPTFKQATPADQKEYREAKRLLDAAYAGNKELFDHPLVKKWFPPEDTKSKFWEAYWSLPKETRKKAARESELIKAILAKGSREFLDETAYGAALEALRKFGWGGSTDNASPADKLAEELRKLGGLPQRNEGGGKVGGSGYSSSRTGARSMWLDFQTIAGPLLMGELREVFIGRRSLKGKAATSLENIRKSFAPDMSLADFITLLRGMFIQYGINFKEPSRIRVNALQSTRNNRRLSRGTRFFVR